MGPMYLHHFRSYISVVACWPLLAFQEEKRDKAMWQSTSNSNESPCRDCLLDPEQCINRHALTSIRILAVFQGKS